MKPLLSFVSILLLVICTSCTNAQNLNQGLIAHYCLNGDAVDAAGSKHGVLMNGASGTLDRANNTNGAIKLDGINDFIQLPSDTWITGDFSFSGWIKVDSIGSWPHLWGFGNGTNAENVFLGLSQGFDSRPHITTHDCFSGSSYYRVDVPTVLPLNQWVHLVVTMSGSLVNIYKDNALWVSNTTTILPCAAMKDSSFIGKSNFTWNNNAYVDADIDDFRFYDRVLSVGEIAELNELEAVPICNPNSLNEIDKLKGLNVFPNPTKSTFTILIPENTFIKSMNIYNTLGGKVDYVQSNNEFSLQSNTALGLYYISGSLNNGTRFSTHLIIEK